MLEWAQDIVLLPEWWNFEVMFSVQSAYSTWHGLPNH